MTMILVANVLDQVRLSCREAPLTVMTQAYVGAARRLCGRSKWLRVTVPGVTTVGTRLYSLGSDPYQEVLGIRAMVAARPDLEADPPLTENPSGDWDERDANGPPELYQYVPEAQFAIHPLPDAVYDLTITCIVQPKDGANAIDESLLVKWKDALDDGALATLLRMPSVPWRDPREAGERERKFEAAIYSALHNAARGYNAGSARTGRLGPANGMVRTSQQIL